MPTSFLTNAFYRASALRQSPMALFCQILAAKFGLLAVEIWRHDGYYLAIGDRSTLLKECKMATVEDKHESSAPLRSPNYPYISLPSAIEKTRKLYDEIGRHLVGADVAIKALGHSPTSGAGKKTLGALRSFGLVDDSRVGRDVRVKVSTRGLDIVADYREGDAEWSKAVQDAARAPRIHAAILDQYGGQLPPDGELRRYLVRVLDPPFTDAGASDFIAEISSTLQYANKLGRTLDTPKNENDPETPRREVQVGSLVQWTSNGVDQFPQPRKVLGADGEWAFVEGNPTGVPMSELTVIDPPKSAGPAMPPTNPFHTRGQAGAIPSQSRMSGFPTISLQVGDFQEFPLYTPSGKGTLSVPAQMTKKAFELLKLQISNSLCVIEATAIIEDQAE